MRITEVTETGMEKLLRSEQAIIYYIKTFGNITSMDNNGTVNPNFMHSL